MAMEKQLSIILCAQSLSRVQLFATPWTAAHQVSLSMGFPRQEYWNELAFPPPGDLPDPEIEPMSPALAGGFFTSETLGKLSFTNYKMYSLLFFLHLTVAELRKVSYHYDGSHFFS